MRVLYTSVRSISHLWLWLGVLVCGFALLASIFAGMITPSTASAADNDGTSVTFWGANSAGIRIIGEQWAGRGWYSQAAPAGLGDLEDPSHIVLGKTPGSNPVTYSGRVYQTGGYVGGNSQPCAFNLTITMTSASQGTVGGSNPNLGGDCNATTIADIGLPATFRVSGDLPPEFGNVSDENIASGNAAITQRWAQGDTREINQSTLDRYTEDVIREYCGESFNDGDSPNYDPEKHKACIDNALAARAQAIGETSNCNIDGIGWLICPTFYLMAQVTDTTYGIVSQLLSVNANMFTASGGSEAHRATYTAWSLMRNIANVAFVIAFIIIIYSQLTGVGVSNYGVKKLLPRIIVAAILVNVSFFACALAVDLSNVLGTSTKGVFDNLTSSISASVAGEEFRSADDGSELWALIVGGILSGTLVVGGLALAGFTILIPILIGALAAIVTLVLVLLLRQALIILLVIISPLAFVAFLLPNTEKLFNIWRRLLVTLLLMYPIIGFIFGGSTLAGVIVMQSSDGNVLIQIMGAGITVVPLFITPVVMRFAGGVLNRFAGVVDKADKRAFDRMRNRAKGYRDYRTDKNNAARMKRAGKIINGKDGSLGGRGSRRRRTAAFLASGGVSRGASIRERDAFAKEAAGRTEQEYNASRATDPKYAKKMAGDDEGQQKILQARAVAKIEALDDEAVKNQAILMKANLKPGKELEGAATILASANNTSEARAAQSILLGGGSAGLNKLQETLEENGDTIDPSIMSSLRKDVNAAGVKSKNAVLAKFGHTDRSIEDLATSEDVYEGLTPRELAGQSAENIRRAGTPDPVTGKRAISRAQAERVLDSPEAQSVMSQKAAEELEAIRGWKSSSPSPQHNTSAPAQQAPNSPAPQNNTYSSSTSSTPPSNQTNSNYYDPSKSRNPDSAGGQYFRGGSDQTDSGLYIPKGSQ